MTKGFKKGDAVYRIASWDDKGTFYVLPCRVFSCGKKRMVLEDDAGNCVGRDFSPNDPTIFFRGEFQTIDIIREKALDLASSYVIAKLQSIENAIIRSGYGESDAYVRAMRKDAAAIRTNGAKAVWKLDNHFRTTPTAF